jgi:putative endonuclease
MNGQGGYIYIMTNKWNTVLYTGVTSSLTGRVIEHKEGNGSYFTTKYNCTKLVYYEFLDDIEAAIDREKCIKGYSRKWKEDLIDSINPDWNDLWDEIDGMD